LTAGSTPMLLRKVIGEATELPLPHGAFYYSAVRSTA
jgi:hypothetical protein